MTITELSALIDTYREWNVAGCSVSVQVKDVRSAYGRTDVYVEPVSGRGGAWVRLSSLTSEGGA